MKLTTQFDVSGFIADVDSDPLVQMLREEHEDEEIEALIETQLAWQHVKPSNEREQ